MCLSNFRTSSHTRKHSRIRSGEKQYKCEICPATFRTSCDIKSHSRTHSAEKLYKCAVTFTHAGSMKNHTRFIVGRNHTYVKYAQRLLEPYVTLGVILEFIAGRNHYKCEVCPANFRPLTDLKKHSRVHSGEKPHKC